MRDCVSHGLLKKTLFDTISEIDAGREVEQYLHLLEDYMVSAKYFNCIRNLFVIDISDH